MLSINKFTQCYCIEELTIVIIQTYALLIHKEFGDYEVSACTQGGEVACISKTLVDRNWTIGDHDREIFEEKGKHR